MLDAIPAEIQCGPKADLFDRLLSAAKAQPTLALTCAPLLSKAAQREAIQRQAFATAVDADPDLAARLLPQFAKLSWIADAGFFPSSRLAVRAGSRELLLAAVRANPGLAIREVASYISSTYGREAFELAVSLSPDDAVVIASGNNATSRAVLAALQPTLAKIATDSSLSSLERERLAWFGGKYRGPSLTSDARFFLEAARAGLTGPLERAAKAMLISARPAVPNLAGYSAEERLLLATCGRGEISKAQFLAVAGTLPATPPALLKGRLTAFLSLAAQFDSPVPTAWATQALAELTTMPEAIAIVGVLTNSPELHSQIERLQAERPERREIYGVLAAHLADADPPVAFRPPDSILERYFFYNDEDGIESYQSFLAEYAKDPAWTVEPHDTYIRIASKSDRRAIEILANLPQRDGQADISRLLDAEHRTPDIFVHRGHDVHVDESLRYLNPDAKLVYLGSCGGLDVTATALSVARQAQIVATSGVGVTQVNDPILKALNTELLRSTGAVEWPRFWKSMEARVGSQGAFRDYVPPDKNVPARLMSAYWRALAAD